MKNNFDRPTRIKLFFRSIINFTETFDERAFISIPIEEIEKTWDTFLESLHTLHETHKVRTGIFSNSRKWREN